MNTLNTTLESDSIESHHRTWIIVTVMMLAILEVLDSTIVNVALPSMMASLGANQDQITWVLTSYVVASAIVLPLTGFLTDTIGRKRFLFICATGFMLSSFFCGLSSSLSEMVFFRIIQGICGSSLIPISQTLLRETFPAEEQGKAMAIWGIGILAAPVCGPTLGGFITEHSTWRWVFYINLPFCLIGLFLIAAVIPKTKRILQKIDIWGLVLMVVGVGALQIFLDKGNSNGWFSSTPIQILAATAAFCIIFFIIRCAQAKNPIIKLSLYKDRNFALSSFMMLMFCGTVFTLVTLEPMFLENYFNRSAMQAGMIMAPLGLSSAFSMMICSRLMPKINVKYILSFGLCSAGLGVLHLSQVNLNASTSFFVLTNCLVGLGMGSIMVSLSTYVFTTLDKHDVGEASGLFSYARMLGTSIGISLFSTLVSQMTQTGWHDLTSFVTPFNSNLTHWLHAQHLQQLNSVGLLRLSHQLSEQSGLLGFIDTFKTISIVLFAQIPIVFLLKTVKIPGPK